MKSMTNLPSKKILSVDIDNALMDFPSGIARPDADIDRDYDYASTKCRAP